MRTALASAVVCSLALGVWVSAAEPDSSLETAASIVELGGRTGGVCVVVEPPSPALPLSVARSGSFVVQALLPDPEARDRARQAIAMAAAGRRVALDILISVSCSAKKQVRRPGAGAGYCPGAAR